MRARPLVLTWSLVLTSSCAGAPAANRADTARPMSVTPVPRAPLVTLGGQPAELADVARGRVALVSLWATWCEACSREFEALNRLSAVAAGQGDALVVAVAVGEPRATVDAFVRRHGLRYTQLVDEDFRLADALGQRDVPATLVLDRDGRIVYRGETLDREALGAFRKTLESAR
jgi:peroxiredoxin